jgi:transposase-like protein
MKELSVGEQRYKAVMAVLSDGRTVTEVARDWEMSRQTVHAWLARYERQGMEGMGNRSHRPTMCPHQMPALIEVKVLEMRRSKPAPVPSESAVYRCLVRAGVIDPVKRHRRKEMWKRWERGGPMELWQMDVVGGFLLADGTSAKALTGIDDHSRFCVSARLMLSPVVIRNPVGRFTDGPSRTPSQSWAR